VACGFFTEEERVLVVNRKLEEKVVIITSDGPITITLVSIETTRAKLGFSAPKNIQIFREELLSAATRKEVAHAG
jgi:carbon storage regulator CsrA